MVNKVTFVGLIGAIAAIASPCCKLITACYQNSEPDSCAV